MSLAPTPPDGGAAARVTGAGSPEEVLRWLEDRQVVADVVAAIGATQDAKDWPAFRALWCERVRFDASRHLGQPVQEMSADELTDLVRGVLGGFTATQHLACNVTAVVEGDRARARADAVGYHHLAGEDGQVDFCVARNAWHLGLERRDGRWLIADFAVVRDIPLEGDPTLYDRAAAAAAAR